MTVQEVRVTELVSVTAQEERVVVVDLSLNFHEVYIQPVDYKKESCANERLHAETLCSNKE